MEGKIVWKGGTGSGNHGHEGRPGKVGGSGLSDKLHKALKRGVSGAERDGVISSGHVGKSKSSHPV